MPYVNADTIKMLRERKKITQRQLAEQINVSYKCISKWETGRGLPDISILSDLARALDVSLAELMTGDIRRNDNRSANMKKTCFYVCPICGNVIVSVGEGDFSCCGISLPIQEAESEGEEDISVDIIDDEYYVTLPHEMSRKHYISFIAYVNCDEVCLKKLYPEQSADAHFSRHGPGYIYAYCNRHGLMRKKI